MTRQRLAVIGNGMAAERFLEELVRHDGLSRYDVRVYGEEHGGAYNRILLSKVLEGEDPDAIVTKPEDWYRSHGIGLRTGVEVERLDTDEQMIVTPGGGREPYDLAVLATGSKPFLPPMTGAVSDEGELRPGIFLYRNQADCLAMREHARSGRKAVVLGGGLLGLEAAKVLSDRGLHVTVVNGARSLMNVQLDELGGEVLERHVLRQGIFVRNGHTVEAALGNGHLSAVVLDDGKKVAADMLVVACGVRPRVEVASASGLPINKGVLVNDGLATEAPGVYAIGDCCEHNGKTYGMVAPAWEQAGVLADLLTDGSGQPRYRGSRVYARLKVAGLDVAALGRREPETELDEIIQVVETRRDTYRKLIVRGGELVGAILVGTSAATAQLVQLFDRGDPLPPDPLLALCAEPATSAGSADRQVCNCRRVTEGRLRMAIAEGAVTVEALSETTGAGTGCGSCKSDLAELLARHAGDALPQPTPAGLRMAAPR